MKLSRVVAVIIILAIVIEGYVLLNKGKPQTVEVVTTSQTQTLETVSQTQPITSETETATSSAKPATPVTVTQVAKNNVSYLDLLGTVRANDQVKIFPATSGQIAGLYVQEGDRIKAGDVLFTLTGINGSKAPAQAQFEIAQANFEAAQRGLQVTADGNNSSLRSAQLQLESAQHQLESANLDLQVFDQNIAGAGDSVGLLRDSFQATQTKNLLDLEKARNGIEDLQDAIDNLEEQREDLISSYYDQINSTSDPQARIKLEQELQAKQTEMEKKLDELYKQLDTAKSGYKTLQQASTLTENQVLAQMAQAENQSKVLYLNQQSLENKLGMGGGTSDPVRLAEEGLNAIQVKNAAALTQAKTQLEIAKLNLSLTQAQADALTVRTPISGVVNEVTAHIGDQVNAQSLLTQISGTQNFELRVGVNAESADKIKVNDTALVEIGGRFIKLPIKNIAPNADSTTKLVNVSVLLPKIFFRANQTLKVKIPVRSNVGGRTSGFFIPLDAVIIGTEEQYVFVVKDGKAHKTNLKLGNVSGDMVEVLEGLQESDQIVVNGAKDLLDGQEVEIS